MEKNASAVWHGGLKDGDGRISTESGVLEGVPYGFRERFEGKPGANPEELIAAAHAACFSMALSGQLEQAGLRPDEITTKAAVRLDKTEAGWTVTAVHLETTARLPGADEPKFQAAAAKAKAGCPISRLLGGSARITLDARLASAAV